MVVADSIIYEVFFVVAGGGKELVGVQGDGAKVVTFGVTGIGEGYFPRFRIIPETSGWLLR